ncbi:CFEM domain-containing protein [Aspergillus stella-maris]|uniref:CFEM domain-containing protein n=1 Tax=Aspergillus stella-maris TaxID=1810926 RepID=UPI003CCE3391
MKLQSLALTLAAVLSFAAAQGLDGLPACAQDCATGSIPEECGLIDVECICASRSFVEDIACCVSTACEQQDQEATLDFANGICGGAGVSDLPQTATCAGDSTTTTTGTNSETTATTTGSNEPATTTSNADETSTEATTTTSETSTRTSSQAETSTSSESPSESPAEPEETDGAAPRRGKEVGVLAGIVAGVAFMM